VVRSLSLFGGRVIRENSLVYRAGISVSVSGLPSSKSSSTTTTTTTDESAGS